MTVLYYGIITVCSILGVGLMRLYALKTQMIDIPNQRSSHMAPTPRGGGAVIVIFFLTGGFLLVIFNLLPRQIYMAGGLCSIPVALIGYLDDHGDIPAAFRLLIHFFAASAVIYFLQVKPLIPWFGNGIAAAAAGWIAAVLFLVWLLNLFNFMDGIDGLAGVETLFVALGGVIILLKTGEDLGVAHWLLVLSAATLGFLVWNWPPAKIFMGDVGSGFVGFTFGWLTLFTSQNGSMSIWVWLILYGVFVCDATVTLVRRILLGEKFWSAHRSHCYQILSRRYGTHLYVTLGIVCINIVWLFPWALLAVKVPDNGFWFVLIAYAPLLFLIVKSGAGIPETAA